MSAAPHHHPTNIKYTQQISIRRQTLKQACILFSICQQPLIIILHPTNINQHHPTNIFHLLITTFTIIRDLLYIKLDITHSNMSLVFMEYRNTNWFY